nr:hypothetical protein [Tanacetum cinerariifolium]
GMRKFANSKNLVYTPALPFGKSTIVSSGPGKSGCKNSGMLYSETIILIARFTFHERLMDPLDISRNPSKEKGKRVASPSVTSSSLSSSDDNEGPSFLEFYNELSDNEDLTKAQREKGECLNA